MLDLARVLRSNAPLIVVGIVLIVIGLSTVIPNIYNNLYTVAKYIIAAMAAGAGIYVIYSSMMSRSKVDDLLGALFGLLLLGIAAAIGFGYDVMAMLAEFGTALQSMIPYFIAATIALVGLYLVQRRGAYSILGLFLLMLALALLGFKITNLW